MRTKYKGGQQEYNASEFNDRYQADWSPQNQPLKSPSPDKKAANIIVSTKSPEIKEVKQFQFVQRQYGSCSCQQSRDRREKPFTISTPSRHPPHIAYKTEETQPTTHEGRQSGSRIRNTRIEIVAESTPEDFDSRHVSRIHEMNRSDSMELDYIKLLKSKEETIKELKEIIEMIKRNNTSTDEIDEGDQHRQLRQRNNDLGAEVRELKIENQHLLNVIEKGKKGSPQIKEDILNREVRELKDSLRVKDVELAEISNAYQQKLQHHQSDLARLQSQNGSLLRLLKEKEESLANSALSKSSDKEKLSLIKIKEQYNQNLKLMRDNFHGQLQEVENAYHSHFEELHRRVDQLNTKVHHLEYIKSLQPKETEKLHVREEYHKEKLRHQEIESLMLQKYSKYQNELNQHKRNNDRLIQELIKANKGVDQACQKNVDLQQRIQQLQQQNRQQGQKPNLEISQLLEEKSALTRKVNQLEVDNLALKRQLEELGERSSREIGELERKIEVILKEYEHHSREEKSNFNSQVGQLKEQLVKSDSKEKELKEQLIKSDSKEKELIDYYEKDKIDTEQKVKMAIDLYNRENDTLKAAVAQKNAQLQNLTQAFDRLRQEHARGSSINEEELAKIANECQNLRVRCLAMEEETGKLTNELGHMNGLMREKDENFLRLQNTLAAIQHEKDLLNKRINEAQISNNDLTVRSSRKELESIELAKKIDLLERELAQNSQNYGRNIGGLRQELAQLQQGHVELSQQLHHKQQELEHKASRIVQLQNDLKDQYSRRMSANQPIEEDLKELRRAVGECFVKISKNSEKEIVQEFYKLNFNYELKLEENLKFMKEIDELKTQLADQDRQKQILSEKISLLEQNNQIYERELKERRILYDQLLQEKSKVERQILMSKKIKVEQNHIDSGHQVTIAEITSRIDKLLDLERNRNENIRGGTQARRFSPDRH